MTNTKNKILTNSALTYANTELTRRAGGLKSLLNLQFFYGQPEASVTSLSLIILPVAPDAWHNLLTLPANNLDWLPQNRVLPPGATLPFLDPIPVLFWGAGYEDGHKPFAERREDGTVVFYADIIAATLFLLTRWEETVVPDRDEHGRFPATASVAYKQGFLDRPIVDEYALILRAWLKVLCPNWRPEPHKFEVKLSHDVDHVQRFPNWRKGARTLLGDVLKRHDPGLAKDSAINTLAQIANPRWDHYYRGIYKLAELSKAYGFSNDAFYFMAAEPGPFDPGYDIQAPFVRECIETLLQEGFEIGLHPSYKTFEEPSRLLEEKARLDAVLGYSEYGGRQHYLRVQVPDTWRHWEQAGFAYDSTMTYADCAGFRCGTCHPFRPFDLHQNRELDLWEIPLIVMEGTLFHYRHLTPQQVEQRILELAQRCSQVEGTFTLLWHNTSLYQNWTVWRTTYERVLKQLMELQNGQVPEFVQNVATV
ncbi:MAG TPA: hypothetical protein ENN32_08195 [Chloroflexi bacterium]|nr:hypothetical protein [Chloroflexota bacterium]